MDKRDYYDVLGVSREVESSDLKKAYRRLAMKYHPDRNPDNADAESKFKEAKEAYEVLSDGQKRAAYNQFGHAGVSQGGPGGQANAGFRDVFDEVFGDIFGNRGGGQQRAHRGADLRYNLEISLEEAVFGTTSTIRIPNRKDCKGCDGTGGAPGSSPSECQTCSGVGQVRMQQGFFSIQQTCPRCHGKGKTITDPCRECGGQGWVREQKSLSAKIPPGVDNGDRIRLSGEGERGDQGGPSGDLYVEISVREHPIFARDGNHLYCEVPISFPAATLGGDLQVPTLDGQVNLKVPPETQTGKLFRLRGKGVRSVRGSGVGDLMCRVVVETPVHLNKKQKELLKTFDEAMRNSSKTHDPKASSWLGNVKNFFEDFNS